MIGWAILLLALTVWTVLAAGVQRSHVGDGVDDGIYFVSAQALRDGAGYVLPSRPAEPSPKYPIGLPAVIAGVLKLTPGTPSFARDAAVARGVIIGFALLFFISSYVWLRRLKIGLAIALLIVLAAAFHPLLFYLSSMVQADLPFAGLAVLLFARWSSPSKEGNPAVRNAFINGLLAGSACLIRLNGVALIAGALVAAWVGPRRRSAAAASIAGAGLVLLPGFGYAAAHRWGPEASGSYAPEVTASMVSLLNRPDVFLKNLGSILQTPAYILLPALDTLRPIVEVAAALPWAAWVFRLIVAFVLLVGVVVLARRSDRTHYPIWVYTIATLTIFAFWPGFHSRFVVSLFPAAFLALGAGVFALYRTAGAGRLGHSAAFVALLTLTLGSAITSARVLSLAHENEGFLGSFAERVEKDIALDALVNVTEPNAVVLTTEPETVFLYTGRQGLPLVEADENMLGHLGWDWLQRRLPGDTERPFYLFGPVPGYSREAASRQAAALAEDERVHLHEIYRSDSGRWWIAAITDHPPLGTE